jgi:hypothetical protein
MDLQVQKSPRNGGGDSHDHLITAEDRFNIAMAHQ